MRSIRKSSDGYILLYDDLSWEQIAKLKLIHPDFEESILKQRKEDFYPYKQTLANILGYVSAVSNESAKSTNALLKHPDFKIGKMGLEKIYENQLRGKAGISHIEVDAYGSLVRGSPLETSKESIAGEDINLSLDLELQKYSYNLVKDKEQLSYY